MGLVVFVFVTFGLCLFCTCGILRIQGKGVSLSYYPTARHHSDLCCVWMSAIVLDACIYMWRVGLGVNAVSSAKHSTLSPGILTRSAGLDASEMCRLVQFNSGSGCGCDVHCVICSLTAKPKYLFFLYRHMLTVLHACVLHFWPHQLRPAVFPSIKRLAAIPPFHTFPALFSQKFSSCQRSLPSDSQATANTGVFSQYFLLAYSLTLLSQCFSQVYLVGRWCKKAACLWLCVMESVLPCQEHCWHTVCVSDYSASICHILQHVRAPSECLYLSLTWWAAKKSTVA